MNRQEQIEIIAKFCGVVPICFDPFVSATDAALVRRKCEERGWDWMLSGPHVLDSRYSGIIIGYGAFGATEHEALCLALLAAIEAEGAVR